MAGLTRRFLLASPVALPLLSVKSFAKPFSYTIEDLGEHISAYDSNGNRFIARTFVINTPGSELVDYCIIDKDLIKLHAKSGGRVDEFIESELNAHIEGMRQMWDRRYICSS